MSLRLTDSVAINCRARYQPGPSALIQVGERKPESLSGVYLLHIADKPPEGWGDGAQQTLSASVDTSPDSSPCFFLFFNFLQCWDFDLRHQSRISTSSLVIPRLMFGRSLSSSWTDPIIRDGLGVWRHRGIIIRQELKALCAILLSLDVYSEGEEKPEWSFFFFVRLIIMWSSVLRAQRRTRDAVQDLE